MSDDVSPQSPIPYGLVEHVHRSKSGKTVMAITLSIETRARLAQAALDLGCSKLALIRAAIGQYLILHEENRSRGQERAYQAVETVSVPPVGASSPVPDPEPRVTGGSTVAEPEHSPAMEPEPEPEPVVERASRKPSRKKS